jgi:hypothetical protein
VWRRALDVTCDWLSIGGVGLQVLQKNDAPTCLSACISYIPIPTWLPADLFFLRFWGFFWLCFTNHFRGVFELLVQRNGQKRDKTNQRKQRQGTKIPFFFCKTFLTWILFFDKRPKTP